MRSGEKEDGGKEGCGVRGRGLRVRQCGGGAVRAEVWREEGQRGVNEKKKKKKL